MPDTMDETETQVVQDSAPGVMDLSKLDKTQRSIQYLQHAGLIAADDHQTITMLNVLKRTNHAASANEPNAAIQAAQARFEDAMQAGDVATLTEGGKQSPVVQLVDAYLTARVEHNKKIVQELDTLPSNLSPEEYNRTRHRAVENARKDEAERQYYQGSPELINGAVREHPESLQHGYMSLGKLAVETGLIQGDKATVRDMVDDTLAAGATHAMMHVAEEVMGTSENDLKRYQDFPHQLATNILAKADDTAASTTPIDRASPAEEGTTPQLARIQAMNSLLSAHLHELTKHTVDPTGKSDPAPEVLAQNFKQVQELVMEYRMATLSLASKFLAEGPAAGDPRMQQLRQNLNQMMDENNIPRYTEQSDIDRDVSNLVERSAAYLLQKNPGNVKAQANIAALLAQVKSAPEQGMAERLTDGPAATHAKRAERSGSSVALGQ